MLGLGALYSVQRSTMKAYRCWRYIWSYSPSEPGVFFSELASGAPMRLTDTAIRKARTIQSACQLPDGGDLYLQVTPAGGKLWRWKYRFDDREKLMTFGSYPDVFLSLARERHA